MANLFGNSMPILYTAGEATSLTLPVTDKGEKIQTFEKIAKTWLDGDQIIQERAEGWRLRCEYYWEEISAANRNNISDFLNTPGQKFIHFPTFPQSRKYGFIVIDAAPGLAYGYDNDDSFSLVLQGTHIIQRYPNLDEFYAIVSPYYRILNTS